MRPGQNRRIRGRSRSKGPNPLTRSYESNGPDVKVRGTAQHVADKYAQLSRDAQASGDPVAAENYLQHAEHYYRIIATAQEAYRQQYGVSRPFDEDGDEGDDEAMGANGYGGPGERTPGAQGGQGNDEYGDPGSQAQPFETRSDNGDRGPRDRYERGDRFERNDRPERNDRQDRGDRQQRFPRPDRPPRQDFQRPDRAPRQDYQRQDGPRQDNPRHEQPRREGPRQDYQRQEGPRHEGSRQDSSRQDGPREEQRADVRREPRRDEPDPAGLPAFLTNPVRVPIAVDETERADSGPVGAPEGEDTPGEVNGRFAARPRRRRRARAPDGEAIGETGANFASDEVETPPAE